MVASIATRSKDPLFSKNEAEHIHQIAARFVVSKNLRGSLAVEPGQSFRLDLLEDLGNVASDSDLDIIRQARAKVETGVSDPIDYSGVFRRVYDGEGSEDPQLLSPDGNWKSADLDPMETQRLIDKEIADGFVAEFDGTMQPLESGLAA